MNCPHCGHTESKVIDSRDVNDGVRRRRQCLSCDSRFTTYERIQPVGLFVVKKDRRREEFNKEKLLSGIRKACEKRPLAAADVDKLADDIEAELYVMGRSEVSASSLGDMTMDKLKTLDNIAYIRFASVYRNFQDVTEFKQEVDSLVDNLAPESCGQLSFLNSQKLAKAGDHRRRRN